MMIDAPMVQVPTQK